MDIKILIATHKSYKMPKDNCYLPIHVGKEGKCDIGYIGDNTGQNISVKNPYYCELTGLYWAWKNLKCDYIGLAHYRRHFSNKKPFYIKLHNKFDSVLKNEEVEKLVQNYDVILPQKRKYYIETVYTHYGNTFESKQLDEVRNILVEYYKDYVNDFDILMNSKSAHIFNMFIMKKDLADKYCEWLFFILDKLEDRIDLSKYDAFEARVFGRVSERLLGVWIEYNKLEYKEIPYIYMEKVKWGKKCMGFLMAKFFNKKYKASF